MTHDVRKLQQLPLEGESGAQNRCEFPPPPYYEVRDNGLAHIMKVNFGDYSGLDIWNIKKISSSSDQNFKLEQFHSKADKNEIVVGSLAENCLDPDRVSQN